MNFKRYLILFLTLFSAYVTGLLSMEQPERFKRKAPEEEIEPPAKEIKTERRFEIEQPQITVGPQFTIVSEDDREFPIGKNVLKDVSPYFAHEFETAERGLGRERIAQNRIKIGEPSAIAFPLLNLMNQQFMVEKSAPINYDYSAILEQPELLVDFFQLAFKWQLDTIGAKIINYIFDNIDLQDEQTINNLLTYPIEQLHFIIEKVASSAENLELLFTLLNYVGPKPAVSDRVYKEFATVILNNTESIKQNQKLMVAFETQNSVTENLKKELLRSPIQTIKIAEEFIQNLHMSADGQTIVYNDEIGRNLVIIDRLANKVRFETFENIQQIAYQPYSNLLAIIIRFFAKVAEDALLYDARTAKRQMFMQKLNTMAWHPKDNILATIDHDANFSISYIKVLKPGESSFPFNVEQKRIGTLNVDESMQFAWSSDGNFLIILLDNEILQIHPAAAFEQVLLTKNAWKDILKQEKGDQRIYDIFADNANNIIFSVGPEDDMPKNTYIWNWQSDTVTKLAPRIFDEEEQYSMVIVPIALIDNQLIIFEDHYDNGFIRLVNTAMQKEIWHLQTRSYFGDTLPTQSITANNHYLAYQNGNEITIYLTDASVMTLRQLINALGSRLIVDYR